MTRDSLAMRPAAWVAAAMLTTLAAGCGGGSASYEASPEAAYAPAPEVQAPSGGGAELAAGPAGGMMESQGIEGGAAPEAPASPAGESSDDPTLAMLNQSGGAVAPAGVPAGGYDAPPGLGGGQPPAGYPGLEAAGVGGAPAGYPGAGGGQPPAGYPGYDEEERGGGGGKFGPVGLGVTSAGMANQPPPGLGGSSAGMAPEGLAGRGAGGRGFGAEATLSGPPGLGGSSAGMAGPGGGFGPGAGLVGDGDPRGGMGPGGMMGMEGMGIGGHDPNAKPDFSNPIKAVETFLNAIKKQDVEALSECIARRATQEPHPRLRDLFIGLEEKTISSADLGELANDFADYKVMTLKPAKSSGQREVVLIKQEADPQYRFAQIIHTRTVTLRKERDDWKVIEFSRPSRMRR